MHTLSGLVGPVLVVHEDGKRTLEYFEGPTFWEKLQFDWSNAGMFGRLGLVLKVAFVSPFAIVSTIVGLILVLCQGFRS